MLVYACTTVVQCKFWDLDYKIEHTLDHAAKFHVDRPRELGDLAVKKRKVKWKKKKKVFIWLKQYNIQ